MKQRFLLFLVALNGVPLLCSQQVSLDIAATFQQHGVEMIGYTSPDFEALLARLAGAGPASATATIHPYTLLVKNSSSAPLSKVVVRYERKDGGVEGTVINTIEGSRPGEELTLTPDSSLTRNLNAHEGFVNQTIHSPAVAPVGPNFDRSFFQHATVAPDLVIFADGGVVGPNAARVLEFVKTDLQAELDILALLEDRSQSDEQVFSVLNRLAAWKPNQNSGWQETLGNGRQRARAMGLLRLITLNGETRDGMAQFLRRVVADRKPSLSMLHRLD